MSRETPESVKREVVRLYFSGLSYEDIASKLRIGKATVFGIVEDLRGGRFPGYEDVAELAGDMREMAVNLRKMNIAPIEAVGLFTLSKAVSGLGVEPSQLDAWVTMCRSVAKDKEPAGSRLIQEAMRLALLEAEQGLSYEDAVSKYSTSVSEFKELEPKLEATRAELAQLQENKATLVQTCRKLEEERARLEAEKGELVRQTEQLSKRCQELEKTATDLQKAVAKLEEKDKSLRDQVSHLEERAVAVNKEIDERTFVLTDLENHGFSKAQLARLHARLGELAARYSEDRLTDRFLENFNHYDSCLGLEATTKTLQAEVEALTRQKDALLQFGEKLNLAPDDIGEGIVTLKALQKKGVMPEVIVSYKQLLEGSGAEPQAFHKFIVDLGGLERSISAKRKELESITKQVMVEQKTLEQLETEKKGRQAYLAFLKDSTEKEIKQLTASATGEVTKLCQDLQRDIATWGSVRAEIGKCKRDLEMAKYFASLPISEEGVSNLVRDMDIGIIAEYLVLCRAWCRMKFNPKRKPPVAIARKYAGIADYVQIELSDVITWALTLVAEGN